MNKTITGIIELFVCLTFFTACESVISPIDPIGEGISQYISSEAEGTIEINNYSLKLRSETVPRLLNGNPGNIAFSLESTGDKPPIIPSLPPDFDLVGKYVTAGPEGFIYAYPIKITFKAEGESDPSNLRVFRFSNKSNSWKIIPSYVQDGQNKVIAADVLELGMFALAKYNGSTPLNDGGIEYCDNNPVDFYIATIISANFDDPTNSNLYDIVGAPIVSPVNQNYTPSGKCRSTLPLGTYQVSISRRAYNSNVLSTYTLPVTIVVSNSLNAAIPWVYTGAEGWTNLCITAGGQWIDGKPPIWPEETETYGTGNVQATLTWYNSTGSSSDLDLHLYGPNGLHIYYANPTSADFELDRHWQGNIGSGTENIYSLHNNIPSGQYQIIILNYAGSVKQYNIRTIYNGSAYNFRGELSQAQQITVKTFSIP